MEQVIANIRQHLKEYILKNHLHALVLGVSGGIDSACCVALAEPVCKELNIPLVGRSLPIETNKADEIQRAKAIGNAFHTNFREKDLSSMYRAALDEAADEELYTSCDIAPKAVKIARGNIKARCRMIYLYNIAGRNHGIVLSTDNYTELMLGFWTIFGDCGDFGMIQSLWKTEVYALSRFLVAEFIANNHHEKATALQDCIDAIVTDGLGVSDSSLDQIRAKSYDEVDALLQEYLRTKSKDLETHPVIQRHLASAYKRNHPRNLTREEIGLLKEGAQT